MKMNLIYLLLAFFSLLSCKEKSIDIIDSMIDPSLPTEEIEEEVLPYEIIWQISQEDGFPSVVQPQLLDENILFVTEDVAPNAKYYLFSKDTGLLIWSWTSPEHRRTTVNGYAIDATTTYLVLNDLRHNGIEVIDLQTGQETFRDQLNGFSGNRVGVIESVLYIEHTDAGNYSTQSHLVQIPIGDWTNRDTIFSLYKKDGWIPGLMPPARWENGQGEEILIFQNRSFDPRAGSRSDLFAYNTTLGEMHWQIDSITANSSTAPPFVHENKVYFCGYESVHCVNAATGELLWEYDTGEARGLEGSNLHFIDGNVVFGTVTARFSLNATTGKLNWIYEKTGNCSGITSVYNNSLYCACKSKIQVLDVSTGDLVWEAPNPGGDTGLYAGLTIDPETGYIYGSDLYYHWCIKEVE